MDRSPAVRAETTAESGKCVRCSRAALGSVPLSIQTTVHEARCSAAAVSVQPAPLRRLRSARMHRICSPGGGRLRGGRPGAEYRPVQRDRPASATAPLHVRLLWPVPPQMLHVFLPMRDALRRCLCSVCEWLQRMPREMDSCERNVRRRTLRAQGRAHLVRCAHHPSVHGTALHGGANLGTVLWRERATHSAPLHASAHGERYCFVHLIFSAYGCVHGE